ncbi:MAG TPA: PKD domain-containing protein [Solirubrobacterales bacterium]|nr:PKD domain-containing protein [Solirubrobacterales bacterium]
MRHGLLRNGLIVALSATLALASPWAVGARADVAQVTVVSPGGAQQTLALGALAGSEDVVARAYELRSAAGASTQTLTGFSLAALLAAAGADPYGFSYLEVQRPAGGAVLLGRDQALDAGAFADGPPLVYATAAGTGFLRPSAGAGDLNADDSFEAPQGISVVLRKGSRLQVRAQASTRRTEPGEPVEFSAVVERAGSGERLSYSWYFDDGHSAASPEARHAFAKPGSYDVVLGVTGGGDDAGASAVVTIQVGAAPAGPDRKGGGRNETAGAPDHGSAAGPPTEAGSGGGSVPPMPAPAPTPASPPATPAPQPQRNDPPAPAPEPEGQRVTGRLVNASATPAPAPKPAAARRGQLDDDSGGGIPDAAWGILATLGLLGTGALAEAGGLARLWPRGRAA